MTPQLPSCVRGFSLVEVVLALGIVSFSILIPVALLSVGTDANRLAKQTALCAQITANEFKRLRAVGKAGFPSSVSTRYYDSELTDLGTQKTDRAVYELIVNISSTPEGTAQRILNAEVRSPVGAPAANQTVARFTTLVEVPET